MKITTLIFDFGDVFINLDKAGAMQNALNLFGLERFDADMIAANNLYEIGHLSTEEFIVFYQTKFPKLTKTAIVEAWNYIIKDFPKYRLEFIQNLAKQNTFKLILLSNTNEMHIRFIKENVTFYEDFKSYFNAFYLSHLIKLRKPNTDIFEFVLKENNILANQCLFIDDTKENTETAKIMGFNVWTIDETKEDVTTLFETKKELF